MSKPIPVSALVAAVAGDLKSSWGEVAVVGELGPPRVYGGNAYLTLKDKKASMAGIMFARALSRVPFDLKEGLEVVCRGTLTIYAPQGRWQIIVESMEPVGVGAQQLAQEQLEDRLKTEGLFAPENKIPIPTLCRRVGVVTSPQGAVIRDILSVLRRRCGGLEVVVYPARVQGDNAAEEIAAGVAALDQRGLDVIIVARGGGSAEDLAAFNTEVVVRAVGACHTPIISAVGHETDWSLCDQAADVRAATPSAAAEIISKDAAALIARVRTARGHLDRFVDNLDLASSIVRSARHLLDAHNPAQVLKRGYAIVTNEFGRPITSVEALLPDKGYRVKFERGTALMSFELIVEAPR